MQTPAERRLAPIRRVAQALTGLATDDAAPAIPVADAFGEPIDARVTEGAAELVVTPVAESVARSTAGFTETTTEGANFVATEAESY